MNKDYLTSVVSYACWSMLFWALFTMVGGNPLTFQSGSMFLVFAVAFHRIFVWKNKKNEQS